MFIAWLVVALKWLAQALMVVSGIWGLFSDPYENHPKTHKRRLKTSGWLKIFMLAFGLLLFAITDIKERAEASERAAKQQAQNDALQSLLLSHLISPVSVRWTPTEQQWLRILTAFNQLPPPANVYFSLSTVQAVRREDHSWVISFSPIQGPQGWRSVDPATFDGEKWAKFKPVLNAVLLQDLTLRFEGGGKALLSAADLLPHRVSISKEAIEITIRGATVNLRDLSSSAVSLESTDAPGVLPNTFSFLTDDPNINWNQSIQITWHHPKPITQEQIVESIRLPPQQPSKSDDFRLNAKLKEIK